MKKRLASIVTSVLLLAALAWGTLSMTMTTNSTNSPTAHTMNTPSMQTPLVVSDVDDPPNEWGP